VAKGDRQAPGDSQGGGRQSWGNADEKLGASLLERQSGVPPGPAGSAGSREGTGRRQVGVQSWGQADARLGGRVTGQAGVRLLG
jgi:hypothetical protein